MTYEEELKKLHDWYVDEDDKITEKHKGAPIALDGVGTQERKILRMKLGKSWRELKEKYGIE